MAQFQTIEKHFNLPYPIRVQKEERVPPPIIIALQDEKIAPNVIEHRKKVNWTYSGELRIHYPKFLANKIQTNEDETGRTFKDGRSIKMFRANYLLMEAILDCSSWADEVEKPHYWEKLSDDEKKEYIANRVYMDQTSRFEYLFDVNLDKLFSFIKFLCEQYWVFMPLPSPNIYTSTIWHPGPFNVSGKRMDGHTHNESRFGTDTPLSLEIWEKIRSEFKKNIKVPLWKELLADSTYFDAIDDTRRAIIDLATAFESFANLLSEGKLPEIKPGGIVDKFDAFFKTRFNVSVKETHPLIYKRLLITNVARNKILHKGLQEGDVFALEIDWPDGKKEQNKIEISISVIWNGREAFNELIELVSGLGVNTNC